LKMSRARSKRPRDSGASAYFVRGSSPSRIRASMVFPIAAGPVAARRHGAASTIAIDVGRLLLPATAVVDATMAAPTDFRVLVLAFAMAERLAAAPASRVHGVSSRGWWASCAE